MAEADAKEVAVVVAREAVVNAEADSAISQATAEIVAIAVETVVMEDQAETMNAANAGKRSN